MHVRVYVTPKHGILDPQGVAVERSLPALGFDGVSDVRVGKFIELQVDLADGTPADQARTSRSTRCVASCSPTPSSRTTPSPSTRREPGPHVPSVRPAPAFAWARQRSHGPVSVFTSPAGRRMSASGGPGAHRRRRLPRHQHRRRHRTTRSAPSPASTPSTLWHKDTDLRASTAIVIPGGFSYGDYLRCGAIARFSPIMAVDHRLRRRRRPGHGHLQRLPDPDRGRLLPGAPHPQHRPQVRLPLRQPARRERRHAVHQRRPSPATCCASSSSTTRATTRSTRRPSSA